MSIMRDECGLLKNYWYAAAQSHQVSKKKPWAAVVLGEMLVLWRTQDGSPVIMRDRCAHRNALLSEGDLFDNCIGCPYHGWTYDQHGTCVNVPSEGPQGKPLHKRVVEVFPAQEKYGLVWVWMGGDHQPDKEPFPMPLYNSDGWRSYYMETVFENNVTNLVENFMDVPHTVFVHRGWFRERKSQAVPMTVERTEDSVLVSYEQPQDEIGWTTYILNPKRLPMVHTDKFYMPNTTRVDYAYGEDERAFIISSSCTPVSEHTTRVYTAIAYKLGWFNALARWFLPGYTRKVITQDVDIMDIQAQSFKHYKKEEFMSTPADALHVHIEALRNWEMAGGKGPKPKPTKTDVTFWI